LVEGRIKGGVAYAAPAFSWTHVEVAVRMVGGMFELLFLMLGTRAGLGMIPRLGVGKAGGPRGPAVRGEKEADPTLCSLAAS